MRSPSAKRALFSSPSSSKKTKYATKAEVYRAIARSQETKHVDFSGQFFVGGLIGTESSQQPCTLIPSGGFVNQRIGNKIKLVKIDITLYAGGSCDALRVALYCPKDPSTTAGASAGFNFVLNPTEHWVLYDKIIPANVNNETEGGSIRLTFNKSMPLRHTVTYDGSNSTDYSRNPVFLMISPRGNNVDANTYVAGRIRTWYKDA